MHLSPPNFWSTLIRLIQLHQTPPHICATTDMTMTLELCIVSTSRCSGCVITHKVDGTEVKCLLNSSQIRVREVLQNEQVCMNVCIYVCICLCVLVFACLCVHVCIHTTLNTHVTPIPGTVLYVRSTLDTAPYLVLYRNAQVENCDIGQTTGSNRQAVICAT